MVEWYGEYIFFQHETCMKIVPLFAHTIMLDGKLLTLHIASRESEHKTHIWIDWKNHKIHTYSPLVFLWWWILYWNPQKLLLLLVSSKISIWYWFSSINTFIAIKSINWKKIIFFSAWENYPGKKCAIFQLKEKCIKTSNLEREIKEL